MTDEDKQPQGQGQPTNPDQGNGDKVTFTDEQQSVIDNLINNKIAKLNEKHAADLKNRQAEWEQEKVQAVKTAEERAKMSADERAKAEAADREKSLDQQRAQLNRKMQELTTKSMLMDRGISADMLPLVMGATDDETTQNLDRLEKYVSQRVQKAKDELMAGHQNPVNGAGNRGNSFADNPWAKESFNLSKQNAIAMTDPEMARQMIAAAKPTGYYVQPS